MLVGCVSLNNQSMGFKMKNIILALVIVGFVSSTCYGARVSCKSFSSQAEAQSYYNAKGKGWKLLDRDKDGEACECLPGGSSYGDSRCKTWRKKTENKSWPTASQVKWDV